MEEQAAHRERPTGWGNGRRLDGYRTAQVLVRQYGADAPIRASMRHDELLERGDRRGVAVWKRVLAAIDALLMEGDRINLVLRRLKWIGRGRRGVQRSGRAMVAKVVVLR